MARVSARIDGRDLLGRRLAGLPAAARTAAAAGLAALAESTAEAARAELARSSGPSSPGTPPADCSGRLAASIAAVADPETGRATVTAAAPEARFLEYGTARMAARPFLRPAALAAARRARTILGAALGRGLRP